MCSRILWTADGQPVLVARTMDWTERMGSKLFIMPRGIRREGLAKTHSAEWTSKYGSVVVSVWDCAVADGLNEAGLSARELYLAETKYGGEADDDHVGITVALWAQYYLDNFATVAEAVEATRSLQIRPVELIHRGQPADAPVHVSLSDATGDSAVIEILGGRPVIHHGREHTVMTNSPIYDEQLVLLKQYQGLGGKKPLPGTAEAEDRFVRGAYYLTQLPKKPASYQEAVAGVLSVIRNMATPIGYVDPIAPNVSPTQWLCVSDLTHRRFYFELTNMPSLVWVDLEKMDLSEGAPVMMFDPGGDLEAAGDISRRFHQQKPPEFQKAGTAVSWRPSAAA